MQPTFGVLSLLPCLLAIILALVTRRILPSLLAGVACAVTIAGWEHPASVPARTIDRLLDTAGEADTLRLVLFSVLMGSLLKLMKDSRSFEVIPRWLEQRARGYGGRTVFGLTWALGTVLILETWSNVLISGTTLGSLYDRLGISRERLAYFIHTIGINVVALVLINSWGAFYMALASSQGIADPLAFLARSVPCFLYSWASLLLVAFVMWTGLTIGPMRRTERHGRPGWNLRVEREPSAVVGGITDEPRVRYMVMPLVVLIGGVLLSLWITGNGTLAAGDGAASVLYAVLAAILVMAVMLRVDGVFDFATLEQKIIAGMAEFIDVAILIVLALALGALSRELGTGAYVAQILTSTVSLAAVPALIFLTGAAMSFATGTSYGTFSIMVPIALPISAATHLPPELLFGACIAGGVFGDNCSPISDTTIVSGMSANVPAVEHARTQLPYALIAAAVATAGYLLIGFLVAR
ncbi:MAG TPA: Na+/H+ antiporter NhaC family protein [Steroidobacteraceae bacterium]|nr:Na+/H+ antiporter NhaC family protein [Steroidobacteraceae bacterium]